MDNLISQLERIPLDGQDLIDIASKMGKNKNTMKWILYDKLPSTLDALFTGAVNAVFILLQIKNPAGATAEIGHWVLLSKNVSSNGNESISFFDPYALSISQDLSLTHEPDTILNLLKNVDVDVNKFKHQSFRDHLNTCGRHCAIRSLFRFMNNKQYNDVIVQPLIKKKEVKDADTLVNLLTGFLGNSDMVVREFFRGDVNTPPPKDVGKPVGTQDAFTTLNNQLGGVLLR